MKAFNDGITSLWQETFLMLTAYMEPTFVAAKEAAHAICVKMAEQFDDQMVEGVMTSSEGLTEIPRSRLGELAEGGQLLKLVGDPTSLVVESRRTLPRDPLASPLAARWWDIQFSRWDVGLEVAAPCAIVAAVINSRRLESVPTDWHQEFIEAFFAMVAATGKCWYGVVDVASAADCVGGDYFKGDGASGPISWHRGIEGGEWYPEGIVQRRPRGVYWGNYFGRDLLNRLDPRNDLVERFAALQVPKYGKRRQRAIRLNHGALLCMSGSPRDMYKFVTFPPNTDGELDKAIWLKRELRQAGML